MEWWRWWWRHWFERGGMTVIDLALSAPSPWLGFLPEPSSGPCPFPFFLLCFLSPGSAVQRRFIFFFFFFFVCIYLFVSLSVDDDLSLLPRALLLFRLLLFHAFFHMKVWFAFAYLGYPNAQCGLPPKRSSIYICHSCFSTIYWP